MDNTPFVHLLRSPYHCYVFDVNTNSLLRISEGAYQYLKEIQQTKSKPAEADEDTLREIRNLQESGFLKTKRIQIIENPQLDDIEYFLQHRVQYAILQVTQQCNFRCSYCSFTYGDDETNRSHSSNHMTWDVAKKAIDFLAERSRDVRHVDVGFYGGEPLLEYDLIQRCIEYAEMVFEGKCLGFSMTTNGSLLTPDRLQYLIDHNTSIMVSLDGPKEIHDKNRKLAANGQGSFDLVYNNLNTLRETLPKYYEKLRFNSVVDPANDCGGLRQFFSCDTFRENDVNTPIMMPVAGNSVYFSDDFTSNNRYDEFLGMLFMVGLQSFKSLPPFGKNYALALKTFKQRMSPMVELPERSGHSGPCRPGVQRVFVTVNGDLYPCEKASETSENMRLGTLDEGYDLEAVKAQLNISSLTADQCRNCWNIVFCGICANQADDGKCFSAELIRSRCRSLKNGSEEIMRDLIAIQEAKEVLDYVQEVTL